MAAELSPALEQSPKERDERSFMVFLKRPAHGLSLSAPFA